MPGLGWERAVGNLRHRDQELPFGEPELGEHARRVLEAWWQCGNGTWVDLCRGWSGRFGFAKEM